MRAHCTAQRRHGRQRVLAYSKRSFHLTRKTTSNPENHTTSPYTATAKIAAACALPPKPLLAAPWLQRGGSTPRSYKHLKSLPFHRKSLSSPATCVSPCINACSCKYPPASRFHLLSCQCVLPLHLWVRECAPHLQIHPSRTFPDFRGLRPVLSTQPVVETIVVSVSESGDTSLLFHVAEIMILAKCSHMHACLTSLSSVLCRCD